MSITIPRMAALLVVLLAVGWMLRRGGPPDESEDTSLVDRAMQGRLELAVVAAANACGDIGLAGSGRNPAEAARRLVAVMASASAPPPGSPAPAGPIVEYVLPPVQKAWQVVVRPEEDGRMRIEGFGTDLSEPLFTRSVPCS